MSRPWEVVVMRTRIARALVAAALGVTGALAVGGSGQPAAPQPAGQPAAPQPAGQPAAPQPAAGPAVLAGPYVKVGYFTQWGIYRRNFLVREVHTAGMAAKLTHINYAFANVGADGRCFEANEAGVGDAWADYQKRFKAGESVDGVGDVYTQPLAGNFNQLRKLKAMYPHLKVMLSIGGWTWSKYFSDAALTDQSRQAFVASCIDLFIKVKLAVLPDSASGGPGVAAGVFEGFDLDWVFLE